MYERLLKRGLCRPVSNTLIARFEAISIDNMYCMLKQCIANMHRIEFWLLYTSLTMIKNLLE